MKFVTIVLLLYLFYYAIVIVVDIGSQKKVDATDASDNLEYDLEPESKPVKVSLEDIEQTQGGSGLKPSFQSSQEEAVQQGVSHEAYKNLGIDLGLETISSEGMEVANDKLKRISHL